MNLWNALMLRIEGANVKRKVWRDGEMSMWALYANASIVLVKVESFDCCLRLYPEHKIKEILTSKVAIDFAPTIAFTVVKIETSTRADGGDCYRLTIAMVLPQVIEQAASSTLSVVDATLICPLLKNLTAVFSQHLSKQVSSMGFGKKVFGTLEIVNINSLEVEYVCESCKGRNVSRQLCNPYCYSCGKPVQILKLLSLQKSQFTKRRVFK
ncbi:hypothetical protein L7F22_062298 [Adiantum nelumboides]|nr:hypothetical protein [Adiantum nelumboides]